jgi:hypothetical protein
MEISPFHYVILHPSHWHFRCGHGNQEELQKMNALKTQMHWGERAALGSKK